MDISKMVVDQNNLSGVKDRVIGVSSKIIIAGIALSFWLGVRAEK